jgi:hypothetical protein
VIIRRDRNSHREVLESIVEITTRSTREKISIDPSARIFFGLGDPSSDIDARAMTPRA